MHVEYKKKVFTLTLSTLATRNIGIALGIQNNKLQDSIQQQAIEANKWVAHCQMHRF